MLTYFVTDNSFCRLPVTSYFLNVFVSLTLSPLMLDGFIYFLALCCLVGWLRQRLKTLQADFTLEYCGSGLINAGALLKCLSPAYLVLLGLVLEQLMPNFIRFPKIKFSPFSDHAQ